MPFNIRAGRLVLPLFIAIGLLAGRTCLGQAQATFYNNTLYTSVSQLPYTNIINDFGGQFNVNPGVGNGWLSDLFQAWTYTQNFTNNGEMESDTGFRFDRSVNGIHTESSSFYNSGNINCGTGFNAVLILEGGGLTVGGFGGVQVWATNVTDSGTITIGSGGLVRIYGNDLDFTRGTLNMQNGLLVEGLTNAFTIYATGQTGINPNAWYPDEDLLPTEALSSPPIDMLLTNSQPYFSVDGDGTGTNFVVRMVFLQNDNTNVPYGVYFGSGFGNGFTTIQWTGSYLNPASGQIQNDYLYMTDDYVGGSSTNILSYASPGIPFNYGFYEQNTPVNLGVPPQTSNYPSLFPDLGGTGPFPPGVLVTTNIYSYVNAQFVASNISTNSLTNTIVAYGALTNLPGRFELVASNELNLSLSTMSGMNYLRLQSTNNFDDDGQSIISAPYSDVYLGRTNNNMVISNLLYSAVPVFNGTVQGWNTRWFYTDTNTGINYDFRALLVESDLNAASGSVQQDVFLYSSNSLVISDTLNIIRNFYANCTNLLLSYNGPGNGADSLAGAVNIYTTNVFWASATPRLLYLTNNGAISTLTLANYGSPAVPYYDFVSTGTVSNGSGANIYALDFENDGAFSAGAGSFIAQSILTTMTNGNVVAAGLVSNVCSSLVISNTAIQAGRSLSIVATNLLTDGDTTNNFWVLGTANGGAGTAAGLVLPIKPVAGDLHGTTISNLDLSGTLVNDYWSGIDYGAVNAGYKNNAAIGQLYLDAQGQYPHTGYYFTGTATNGATNAIYVDCLQLRDYAGYTNRLTYGVGVNIPTLSFNTNLVIYYAQALVENGVSVAEAIDHANGDHLRWVPTYTGIFSSTNLVYPPGTTNTVNTALAESPDIDSNGNGLPNDGDPPMPFLTPSGLNFTILLTNLPPKSVRIQWTSVAYGTNFIFYKTNLLSPAWMPFTGFKNYYLGNTSGTNSAHTNWFPMTPGLEPYPSPETNVWIYDTITNMPHFYQIIVQPWLTYPFNN